MIENYNYYVNILNLKMYGVILKLIKDGLIVSFMMFFVREWFLEFKWVLCNEGVI